MLPHLVAARRLQPDHFGAEVGENHGHQRPGHALGQIDHANAGENLRH
jgi:hypothetical protein